MRALSIRQPYAEQILRGEKKIEYRSRPTNIRERVYIYASMPHGDLEEFRKMGIKPVAAHRSLSGYRRDH